MRKEFEAFLLEKESFFEIEEIEREIVAKNETSFAIDFMRKERAGRVTLWENGSLDLEIICTESLRQELYQHFSFREIPDFHYLLYPFFSVLLGKDLLPSYQKSWS